MVRWILPVFIFLQANLLGVSYAQSKVDSLEAALNQVTNDSSRVKVLYQLFEEYSYAEPIQAKSLLVEGIDLSTKANLDRLKIEGINIFAAFFSLRATYDSAIAQYNKALDIAKKVKFNKGYSEALAGLGETYWRKGNLKITKQKIKYVNV